MACALCLGGCAHPLAVITQHGEIFRGTFMPFQGITMSNEKTTCASVPGDITVLRCSDGRTGIVTYNYCGEHGQMCGGGKVRFSDGTEGDFTTGGAAGQI